MTLVKHRYVSAKPTLYIVQIQAAPMKIVSPFLILQAHLAQVLTNLKFVFVVYIVYNYIGITVDQRIHRFLW